MGEDLIQTLKYLAVAGNVLFILWMTSNGIDEGFRGTIYQKLSYLGLACLLVLNSYLIFRRPTH